MKKNSALTKQTIKEVYRLTIIPDKDEKTGYRILHEVNGKYTKITPKLIYTSHAYGKEKVYWIVGFSCRQLKKGVSISLQRLLYAYFVDDIPEGYEVSNVDNNPMDLSTVKLICRPQVDNLRAKKRQNNQYTCKLTDEEYANNNRVSIFDEGFPIYLGVWLLKHHLENNIYKIKHGPYYYLDVNGKRVYIKLKAIKKEI